MTSQNTVLYTPFAGGRTVRDIVEHSPALVSEAWCRQIVQHILQSLEQQYANNAPHRIITPDSLAVLESGEALLLPSPDGLASDEADSAQDIHALALVIHYAISAEFPPEGPLGPRLYDNYSDELTRTIDRCLGPNLRLRPKTIPELRAMLGIGAAAAEPAVPANEPAAPAPTFEAAQAENAAPGVPVPAVLEVPLDTPLNPPFELSKAEASEPVEPVLAPARQEAPAAPAAMPSPARAREAQSDKPIAATPLKPSAHSVPAAASTAAASAAAPAMAAAAPARAPARTPSQPARKKGGVERWAMIAGAAIVLLAAGSALYVHLNQDNSDDTLALSLPQEQAAQGLDAGEAVVTPPAASAGATAGGDTPSEAQPAAATDADTTPGTLPDAGNAAALPHNTAAPAARQADAVVNGTTYKLLIKPWGTVYVNGVDRGVSPPVKRLTLGQGEHTIRIVNPNFAEHVMTVNAGTAESATIEHDFAAQAEGGR
ncbi:PEGA domain-containing protein [Massilia sp. IC2-278]|uniref:PEGA domain-containing protein n=1 Tax=Massilia sp. IC2-278 TaxID=2887200 RepID=UPI001E535CC4|nr:PEGA domain-containing protein [Massilia sp. IC2-278]MCC2960649.1 PEGA domain-containing protein [Massilia sp. IC2-278]